MGFPFTMGDILIQLEGVKACFPQLAKNLTHRAVRKDPEKRRECR